MYSKISLSRPLKTKDHFTFKTDFASPKLYFPFDIVLGTKTTSLIRPLLDSLRGGLNRGILLHSLQHNQHLTVQFVKLRLIGTLSGEATL